MVPELVSAMYGASDRWVDVTNVVRALMRFGNGVRACNELGGDPLPNVPKVLCCRFADGTAADFAEGETAFWNPINTSHLLYHICPFRHNRAVWQLNIEMLKRHAAWINGKRIISIVQGTGCDDVDTVLGAIDGFRIDRLIVRLNSDLWEMATFPAALREIASTACDEALFYAHAKGVSHYGDELRAAIIWTEAMMAFLLGNRDRVLQKLGRHAAVGIFKREHGLWGADWHYTGSFFGMRHDKLFTNRNWDCFHSHRSFIEFYPGAMIPSQDAYDLCTVTAPEKWLDLDYSRWLEIQPALNDARARWLKPL
jgi:hypothetical protein